MPEFSSTWDGRIATVLSHEDTAEGTHRACIAPAVHHSAAARVAASEGTSAMSSAVRSTIDAPLHEQLTPISLSEVAPARSGERPTVRGKFLYVDGAKFYVRGVTYGAFRPNEAKQEYHDIALIE